MAQSRRGRPLGQGGLDRRETLALLGLSSVYALTSSACGSSGSPTAPSAPPSDLGAQFDQLWTTFDREYSYFEHKRIDWNALGMTFRPRAVAAGDQDRFISVVREMLGHLHDLHVVLRAPSGAVFTTYDPQAFVNWDRGVWLQYLARGEWTQGPGDWGHGRLQGAPYLAIGGWNEASIRAADFDLAIERYRSAPRLILDVRMNGGGNDQLAFEIAGRFARTAVVTGYVRFRNGPGHADFGPPTQRLLNPRGAWQYDGAVQVLIGRRCASSNESFIAAMRQLPSVTLAGDRTAGSSGNPAMFPLAGGWTYTVSRWIEDIGIAPQVVVPASAADFAQGRDPVLDWALNDH